ncbi:CDT1-like protein a, chloroplastic [Abrus precatorius]|uniref:CDT1-like protein a, chloroplastic n=1 Tax=Abrus precatorius TaxID=3816 RepID=A0A8B8LR12_ABRPR|nr:CDT1-like protein a, chloroplastic [Abrus precatorius]
MKYILPEGVCIDKVLVHDKKSLCMTPDMKITLIFEVVEDRSGESADLALRQYFNSRLIDFFNMHPELEKFGSVNDSKELMPSIFFGFVVDKVTDIPEAILPEPFSQKACSLICEDSHVKEFTFESSHANSSTARVSTSTQIETLLEKKFQLYQSFKRHFSWKSVAEQTEKVQCLSSTKTTPPAHASDCLDNQESENTWQKEYAPLSDLADNLKTEKGHQNESPEVKTHVNNVINTPVNVICPPHSVSCNNSESPDMKNVSCSADSLMTETPVQSAPDRLLPTSDVKLQNMPSQKSTACHKPAKRVLDFSLMEGDDGLDIRVDKLESSEAPPEFDRFPESRRGWCEDCNSFGSVSVHQEAEESLGNSFEKTNQNQAGFDTLHKKSSSLLNLVNVIHSIFQSVKRAPLTKEELLQKILMNSFDFVEIREVEEQIESLEKLVPDWICKKLVPTGDVMYCIKEVSDLDSVRSRLFSNVTV